MKQEEKYQIQRGDYFLFQGEVVKVCSKDFCLEGFRVKTKNGKSKHADIEELEPIVINNYTLEQAGFIKTKTNVDPIFRLNNLYVYCHTPICKAEIDKYYIESISTFSLSNEEIRMKINHFHVLQNALRLFGVEVELKQ